MAEINRYSDVVPYENRKYWYKTNHGIGPGTIPKDLHVIDTIESRFYGDFICLDGILNTGELDHYDIKETMPPEQLLIEHWFAQEDSSHIIDEIWMENNEVHIEIYWGDWKHDHWRCQYLMEKFGYRQKSEVITEEDGSDTYSAHHVYIKDN